MAKNYIVGGRRLDSYLRQAKSARIRSVRGLEVGFFRSAQYPDGTPVAAVAAWNELGTERNGQQQVPERPFFRGAIRDIRREMMPVLAAVIPDTLEFNRRAAGTLGAFMRGKIQRSITSLREPPNAPATIERKGGKSNPLIDTGVMRRAVNWRVEE